MSHGIHETEEALEGILQLGLVLWKTFHDGFQISDIGEIWEVFRNDHEFTDAMKNAFDGYKKIPSEVKDLQIEEAVALSGVMLKYLPKYLQAIK